MEMIYLAVGLAVGALVVYFVLKGKASAVHAALVSERDACKRETELMAKQLEDAKTEYASRIDGLKQEHAANIETVKREYATNISTLKQENIGILNAVKQENADVIASLKQEHTQALSELKQEHADRLEREQKLADERRTQELTDLQKSYEEQLALFKEQITTVTEKFLKERSGELQEANTRKMGELFEPLRKDLERMEKSMTDHRVRNAETTASFTQTIKQMIESNERIGREADRLSTALQKQNKTVGNWGELILSELLESQGLKEGTHFDVQQTMKDAAGLSLKNEDTGSRMIPDVILHLADNRDVVVDSKMSLTAFIDYQNAETEEQRQEALKRHIASVRNHVTELAGKNYSNYIQKPRKSIDFVIMFVPIEGALQLALSTDSALWREAFDKKVFIAGGQTLIAALRIIDLTWVNVLQERNTENIMDEARKLIDRVEKFYSEFQAVGKKLTDAQKAYTDVTKRVNDSSQSILSTGRRLEALGARGRKPLPSHIDS